MADQAVPTSDRRYEAYSHAELKAEVELGNSPGDASEIAANWAQLAANLEKSNQSLQSIAAISQDGWVGQAGDAMRNLLSSAATWSGDARSAATTLSDAVMTQAQVAAHAKNSMPNVVEYEPASIIQQAASSGDLAVLCGLASQLAQKHAEAEAAKQQAIDVMIVRDNGLHGATPARAFSAPPMLGA